MIISLIKKQKGQKWSINILLGNSGSALKSDEEREPM